MGCRDCSRCTEPGMNSLLMIPFRLALWAMTCWNLGLLDRKCPNCRHSLKCHNHR